VLKQAMKPKMEVTFLLRHSITNSKDIYTSKSYCFRKWFARSERGIALPHHLLVTVTKTAMGFVKNLLTSQGLVTKLALLLETLMAT